MSGTAHEIWSVFDARRVKAPELRGLDAMVNSMVGYVKNRQPVLRGLRQAAQRIELLEKSIHDLGASHFRDAVSEVRDLARLGRLTGPAFDRAVALTREAAWRAIDKRPFPCQIIGALAMCRSARRGNGHRRRQNHHRRPFRQHLGLGRKARPHRHRQRLPGRPRRRGNGPHLRNAGAQSRPHRPRNHPRRAHRPLPPQHRLLHLQGTGRRFPPRPDFPGHAAHQHPDLGVDALAVAGPKP